MDCLLLCQSRGSHIRQIVLLKADPNHETIVKQWASGNKNVSKAAWSRTQVRCAPLHGGQLVTMGQIGGAQQGCMSFVSKIRKKPESKDLKLDARNKPTMNKCLLISKGWCLFLEVDTI